MLLLCSRLQISGCKRRTVKANSIVHEHFAQYRHQRLVVGPLKAATQAFVHLRFRKQAAGIIIRAAFLFGCLNKVSW
jgi:hypothetical protein